MTQNLLIFKVNRVLMAVEANYPQSCGPTTPKWVIALSERYSAKSRPFCSRLYIT